MGAKGVIGAVALAFAAILAGMVLQEPLPEGATQPYKVKLILFAIRVRRLYIADLQERLGWGTKVELTRGISNEISGPVTDGVKMEDAVFDGVPVRLFFPPQASSPEGATNPTPGVVLIHGGGWVLCNLDSHAHLSSRVARDVGAVVAAVDYRKAPEVGFYDILEDVVKATTYFIAHSGEFGVDQKRIAILGESAGGHLVASLALKLRDIGFHPMPKLQVLIYPITQILDVTLPSYQQNPNGPFLVVEDMAWVSSLVLTGNSSIEDTFLRNAHVATEVRERMAKTYLNHDLIPQELRYAPYRPDAVMTLENEDRVLWDEISDTMLGPYFTPLLAEDLSDLPPAVIYVGQHDLLRDDSVLYAQRLQNAGVPVQLKVDPLGWHAIWNLFHVVPDGEAAANWIHSAVKEQL